MPAKTLDKGRSVAKRPGAGGKTPASRARAVKASRGAPARGRWTKVTPELTAIFDAVLPDDPAVERRQMFGCPCAFTGGKLFAGLHQEDLLVRLDEPGRERLLAIDGARPFEPMPGRRMREYVVVPRTMLARRAKLAGWVARAFAYARALPDKPAKKKGKSA